MGFFFFRTTIESSCYLSQCASGSTTSNSLQRHNLLEGGFSLGDPQSFTRSLDTSVSFILFTFLVVGNLAVVRLVLGSLVEGIHQIRQEVLVEVSTRPYRAFIQRTSTSCKAWRRSTRETTSKRRGSKSSRSLHQRQRSSLDHIDPSNIPPIQQHFLVQPVSQCLHQQPN